MVRQPNKLLYHWLCRHAVLPNCYVLVLIACVVLPLAACGTSSRSVDKSPAYGTLAGTVVLNGAPIPHYGVTIAQTRDLLVYPKAIGVNHSDGHFHISGIRPGVYDIIISGPGFARHVLQRRQVVSKEVANVGILSVSAGRVIMGRVTDEKGRPAKDVSVRVQRFDDPRDRLPHDTDPLSRLARESYLAVTDSDGHYSIHGITDTQDGGLRIIAILDGRMSSDPKYVPTGNATIDLVAHPVGTIAGEVLGGLDPTTYVVARLSSNPTSSRQATPDKNGFFRIENVPVGTYRVEMTSTKQRQQVIVSEGRVSNIEFSLPSQ